MSEPDDLVRLRGEIAALKDVLILAIRGARGLDPTRDAPETKKLLVGTVLRNIKTEPPASASHHADDVVFAIPEERVGYTEMLVKIKKALERV